MNQLEEEQTDLAGVQGLSPFIPAIDTFSSGMAAQFSDVASTASARVQEALSGSNFESLTSTAVFPQISEVEKAASTSVPKLPEYDLAGAYESMTPNYTIPDHSPRNFDVSSYFTPSWRQLIILGNGALRVSARSFLEEVQETERAIRKQINS